MSMRYIQTLNNFRLSVLILMIYYCYIIDLFQTFDRLLALVESQGEWNPFTFISVGKNPNYVGCNFQQI